MKNKKEYIFLRFGFGHGQQGFSKDYSFTIKGSAFEHNNFIIEYGTEEPKILLEMEEIKSCASRKRGDEYKIKTRKDGVANCVTIIDTDSMLTEPLKIPQATKQGYIKCPVGGVFDASCPNSELRRGIVQENGEVSPALTTNSEGAILRYEGRKPKIVGFSRDKEGKIVKRHLQDTANTIHTSTGSGSNTNQYVAEGIEYKGKLMMEGDAVDTSRSETFGAHVMDGVSPTLRRERPDAVAACEKQGMRYRIRKLTEREVFRLMDVSEEDIDKIQAARISKTAQYKLAGNSIVVSCLYHIFRKMFIETRFEQQQLSLF